MGADKAGARYGKAGTGVLDDNGTGMLAMVEPGRGTYRGLCRKYP